jgi:mRNA interferase MazF
MKQTHIKRGDIFWVDFDPSIGTEVRKKRPALVCSSNAMNEKFPRIIVAPITSNISKVYSFEYVLLVQENVKGKVMLDQLRSMDKSRFGNKIGGVSLREMHEIDAAIKLVLGIQ